jgi:uncharacterized protein (TIGR01777 family)
VLGFFEPRGVWAMLVLAVLAAEVMITLMDFVEEDMSRKLPASERITHTLLAINYGAILALLVPVLLRWAGESSAVVPAWYEVASVLAPLAAAGVVIFALRDFFASRRAQRLVRGNAAELVRVLPQRRHVLVTGATGFIGSRLVEAFACAGHEVTVLARKPEKAATLHPSFHLVTALDQIAGDTRIDTIVNLAGEPIANGLWTRSKRRRILASRLRMTRAVVALIGQLHTPPALLISGSAIGWYGAWQDECLNEFDGGKRSFGHRVCEAWEVAAKKAQRVRVVQLRIGLVLATEAGMLANLLAPFEFGLGGPIGSGAQWMSWIARDDLIRLIAHVMANAQLTGPLNATAPQPVRNEDFARELARALHRPALPRMPGGLLHRVRGDMADELLLTGRRVLPDKAQASGFKFRHETLRSALAEILAVKPIGQSTVGLDHAAEMQRAQ